MEVTRRQLFRAGTAAAVGMGIAACRSGDPYTPAKEALPGTAGWRRFEERAIATACGQCSARCSVRVRVYEGRAVRIDGVASHPAQGGGIGPRGAAGVQALYDPDRIRQPLVRRGGSLEPISWDDAVELLAERLRHLRGEGRADALLILSGRPRGMVRDLWSRLAASYGTPNHFDFDVRKGGGLRCASRLMLGFEDVPAYDWGRIRLAVSFGAPLLAGGCRSIHLARHPFAYGDARPRIVQVEPSYSRAAAHADEWISLEPGSYAALALAIAHVIVRDELFDQAFVAQHTSGFEDWRDAEGVAHRGFREHVLDGYAPESVAGLCGVPAGRIEALARELGTSRSAVVVLDAAASQSREGLQAAQAVLAVNALLGNVQSLGGIVDQQPVPLAPWPAIVADEVAETSRQREPVVRPNLFGDTAIDRLPEGLVAGGDARVDTVILDYANPCYSAPNPERWRRALADVPFVVTTSPFLDESCDEVADLVLPEHTYLERFEDAAATAGTGLAVMGVFQPAVEPLYDTRATGDVIIDLAKAIGGTVAEAFPWKGFRYAFAQRALGIHRAQRGSIVASSPKAFFRDLFREGFWAEDPAFGAPVEPSFSTPSGRFEFAPEHLRTAILAHAERTGLSVAETLGSLGLPSDLDRACLPHVYPERVGPDRGVPQLRLDAYRPATYAEGSGANLPLLQELNLEPGRNPREATASMAPATADSLDIADGDRVVLRAGSESLVVVVRRERGTRAGVVRVRRGGGHTAFGRFAQGRGVNPMRLVNADTDAVGGYPHSIDSWVEVHREKSA